MSLFGLGLGLGLHHFYESSRASLKRRKDESVLHQPALKIFTGTPINLVDKNFTFTRH